MRKLAISKNQKIILILLLVAILITGCLIFFINYSTSSGKKSTWNVELYGEKRFYKHYDGELSTENNLSYQQLDRVMRYINGGESIGITEENSNNYGSEILFFYNYFQTIISGKYEKYHELFSSDYFNSDYYNYFSFPAFDSDGEFYSQMLYDISVEYNGTDEDERSIYSVNYKIYRNDGSFRRDILSDEARSQLYYIKSIDGVLKIDMISFE